MWWLKLAVWTVLCLWGQLVASETRRWYATEVSVANLTEESKVLSLKVAGDTVCAMWATRTPASYLYTYENGTCDLYDVKVDVLEEPPQSPARPCMTRLLNVCITADEVLNHGDPTVVTVEACDYSHLCLNRSLVLQVPATAAVVFQDAGDLGWLYKSSSKNWCAARLFCFSQGADLLVAPNMTEVLQTYWQQKRHNTMWLGVYNRKWLNGSDVEQELWNPQYVADLTMGKCGRIKSYLYGKNLVQQDCTTAFPSMCQRSSWP